MNTFAFETYNYRMTPGTTISCSIPDGCVNEGMTVTVTCNRSLDQTVQTRIEISSEDGTATG